MIFKFVGFLIVFILWLIIIPFIVVTIVLFVPPFICLAAVMGIEDFKNSIVRWFL